MTREGGTETGQQWYWWREPARVERREIDEETSDIWQRGRDGQIFYFRVFHQEKHVIEFTPGDLRALQHSPHWEQLTSIIDPTWLTTTLHETGTVDVLGRQARRYQGDVNGVAFEVWWLDAIQLPAFVRQRYPDREITVHLKEIHPIDKSPWPRSQISAYTHLDYADLGDKESDPFARSLRHGARHPHHH